jgi:hypothetical protein
MVEKTLNELFARRARLDAERDGADAMELPEELQQSAHQPDVARVIAGERKLFELRRQAQEGQKAQLRERIAQLKDEVRGYTDQVAAKHKEIEFIGKELEGVRDLWQKNLVPITRVTALESKASADSSLPPSRRARAKFRKPSCRSSSSTKTCGATSPRSSPTFAPRSPSWPNARSRRWISCSASTSARRSRASFTS